MYLDLVNFTRKGPVDTAGRQTTGPLVTAFLTFYFTITIVLVITRSPVSRR